MRQTCNIPRGIQWTLYTHLEDLDFADDIALLSSSHSQMQKKTNKMTSLAKRVGLNINEKTKILRLNKKKTDQVQIEGKGIEDVDEFTYLGATVSKEGGGGKDMSNRINKARNAFI